MSAFVQPSHEVEAELLALERKRCAAICANDVETLEPMMSETLTYVHKSGSVEDYAAYFAGLSDLREFKSVEREGLAMRICGDVAVMTGIQRVLVRRRNSDEDFREIKVFATQIWVRNNGQWQMDVYHSTGV